MKYCEVLTYWNLQIISLHLYKCQILLELRVSTLCHQKSRLSVVQIYTTGCDHPCSPSQNGIDIRHGERWKKLELKRGNGQTDVEKKHRPLSPPPPEPSTPIRSTLPSSLPPPFSHSWKLPCRNSSQIYRRVENCCVVARHTNAI